MADDVDRSNAMAEVALEAYIAQVRARANYSLLPVGVCYNCEEPIQGGRLFCDGECRADYDYRVQRNKANGRIDEDEDSDT